MRRRVLLVSPHFPPDTSAASHRVRLLAPHLPAHGWEPVVVTLTPESYEGRLDPELSELVPDGLRVVRCRALPARLTRRAGFGDLGLRALPALARTCGRLLAEERFDALFITIYPTYPALLGPWLRLRHGVPFVLDYQDPWVGSWGRQVGGGPGGAPDARSRLTRRLALLLEPLAAGAADALTAVSAATYEEVIARHPDLGGLPRAAIPLGGEPADFAWLRAHPRPNGFFDPGDGGFHLCSAGTLLPLGGETLRALLGAVARLGATHPGLAACLTVHFFGTSNQTSEAAPPRVLPVARELGVAARVREVAPRLSYLDALRVLSQAGAILLLGSSEAHYTASRIYPAILAERPLLAAYHEASSGVGVLRQVPRARVVTYGDSPEEGAASRIDELARALAALIGQAGEAPEKQGPGSSPGEPGKSRTPQAPRSEARNLPLVQAPNGTEVPGGPGEAESTDWPGPSSAGLPPGAGAFELAGRLATLLDRVSERR